MGNGVMLVGMFFAPQKAKCVAWKNMIMIILAFMDLVLLLNVSPSLPPKRQNPSRSLKRSCRVVAR
jgi:hypothetical protein